MLGTNRKIPTRAYSQYTTVSKVEANQILGWILGIFNNALASIRMYIADNFQNLSHIIVDQAIREKAEDAIDGVYSDNMIYLIRDKHATSTELEKFTNCVNTKDP